MFPTATIGDEEVETKGKHSAQHAIGNVQSGLPVERSKRTFKGKREQEESESIRVRQLSSLSVCCVVFAIYCSVDSEGV